MSNFLVQCLLPFLPLPAVVGIEPRTLCILGKHATPDPQCQAICFQFCLLTQAALPVRVVQLQGSSGETPTEVIRVKPYCRHVGEGATHVCILQLACW